VELEERLARLLSSPDEDEPTHLPTPSYSRWDIRGPHQPQQEAISPTTPNGYTPSPQTGGLPPQSLSLRKSNHSVLPALLQTATVPHRSIRLRPVLVALKVAGNSPCPHPLTGRRPFPWAESRRVQRVLIQGRLRAGGKIQVTQSIRSMLVRLSCRNSGETLKSGSDCGRREYGWKRAVACEYHTPIVFKILI
jgi:hypothetical protein